MNIETRNDSFMIPNVNIEMKNGMAQGSPENPAGKSVFELLFTQGMLKNNGSVKTNMKLIDLKVSGGIKTDESDPEQQTEEINLADIAAMMKGSTEMNPEKMTLMGKSTEISPDKFYADELQIKSVQERMKETKQSRILEVDPEPDNLEGITKKSSAIPDETKGAFKLNGFETVEKGESVKLVSEIAMAKKHMPAEIAKEITGIEAQTTERVLTGAVDNAGSSKDVPEILKTEVYSQIGREVLTRLEQKGPMEFSLQLKPKDLGTIDIKLKISEGKLVIDIMAANAKTQLILSSQVDRLITNLGLQNVRIESVQIGPMDQGITEQQYAMSGGTSFSQRRNHEQTEKQSSMRRLAPEISTIGSATELASKSSLRMMTNKMDYAV